MANKHKYIPFEKLSKKAQKEFYKSQRSDSFGMNMVTSVVPDKTKYTRKQKHKEVY